MTARTMRPSFNRIDLKTLEAMLRGRRTFLMNDLQGLEKEEIESAGQISGQSIHSAEFGADRSAHDVSLGCMESATIEVQEIDEALERIRMGSFGLCETCGSGISKERLGAIPYARLCLSCKKSEEAA